MLTNCILQISLTFCGITSHHFSSLETHVTMLLSYTATTIPYNTTKMPFLPQLCLSFSASTAFLDKTMSSPPHSCVGMIDQLKNIWNSLKAKNKSPSEEVSTPKVRNIKHWGARVKKHSQANWRRVRENSQKKD